MAVVVVVVAAVASIRCWGANRMWMPATKRTRVFLSAENLTAHTCFYICTYIYIYLFFQKCNITHFSGVVRSGVMHRTYTALVPASAV